MSGCELVQLGSLWWTDKPELRLRSIPPQCWWWATNQLDFLKMEVRLKLSDNVCTFLEWIRWWMVAWCWTRWSNGNRPNHQRMGWRSIEFRVWTVGLTEDQINCTKMQPWWGQRPIISATYFEWNIGRANGKWLWFKSEQRCHLSQFFSWLERCNDNSLSCFDYDGDSSVDDGDCDDTNRIRILGRQKFVVMGLMEIAMDMAPISVMKMAMDCQPHSKLQWYKWLLRRHRWRWSAWCNRR